MQFIFGAFAPTSCATTPKAVAPLVTDSALTIAPGNGITVESVFTGVSAAPAPYGGFVSKSLGCEAVKLVVTYLTGDDCDACTVDTLTTVDVTVTVPANAAGIQLPVGYITVITAQVVDDTGTPINSALGGALRYTSSRAGACGTDILVP